MYRIEEPNPQLVPSVTTQITSQTSHIFLFPLNKYFQGCRVVILKQNWKFETGNKNTIVRKTEGFAAFSIKNFNFVVIKKYFIITEFETKEHRYIRYTNRQVQSTLNLNNGLNVRIRQELQYLQRMFSIVLEFYYIFFLIHSREKEYSITTLIDIKSLIKTIIIVQRRDIIQNK